MTNSEAWVRFASEAMGSGGNCCSFAAKKADKMLKQYRKRQKKLAKK